MTEETRYWLMKSEPDVYGIKELEKEKETLWDGIRNYQARNFMRTMEIGDKVFFYHSNCKPPGIIGLMEVIAINQIDPTQFDPNSKYFDPKSTKENPRWDCAKLKYLKEYKQLLSLKEIANQFNDKELILVKKGNRLSILPIVQAVAEKLIITLEKSE
ncbi:EVE domain-containing protein [Prochlorococcus marinus]|uniref:EVE domain-containing protein n=1 Tax=Prochlorococcus marinus TaxID=1219 RepID=UPI0022B551DD|nr:EVE domain-containing protein [Prochlorococcus marinus]